jgi:hypothetical protein
MSGVVSWLLGYQSSFEELDELSHDSAILVFLVLKVCFLLETDRAFAQFIESSCVVSESFFSQIEI